MRCLEQFAVELEHVFGQRCAEAATVHVGPQGLQHALQGGRIGAVGLQQFAESAFAFAALVVGGQQAHVFGKHAEQAAREEGTDLVGRVAIGFQAFGHRGQHFGHFAGDLCVGAAGVQRHGVSPDHAARLAG